MFASLPSGSPDLDARDDFARARRAQLTARTLRWVAGRRRPARPRTICDGAARTARPARLAVIALDAIVGTVEDSPHFDDRFRPASPHLRARWERIALAQRRGVALPPITVVEGPDGFYVVDGRHRVSVARAANRREIEAWVR